MHSLNKIVRPECYTRLCVLCPAKHEKKSKKEAAEAASFICGDALCSRVSQVVSAVVPFTKRVSRVVLVFVDALCSLVAALCVYIESMDGGGS